MNNKQTAVEQLEKKLKTYLSWSSFLEEDFEQAKQIEKEQIIDAHGDEQSHLQDDGSWRTVSAEQYYNEEYNK